MIKALVVVFAVWFLYNKWETDTWDNISKLLSREELFQIENLLLLFVILDLNSVTWLLEAERWKLVLKPWFRMDRLHSLRTVLGSLSFSFLTPNYVGDYVIRAFYLPERYKKLGPAFTFICSIGHLLMICLFGLILGFEYLINQDFDWPWYAYAIAISAAAITIAFFAFMGFFFRLGKKIKFLKDWIPDLEIGFKPKERAKFLGLTLLRYLVMCIDEVFLVYLFQGSVDVWPVFKAVCAYYFAISFIPHFVFTGLLIRGSIGVWIFTQVGLSVEVALGVISMSWLLGIGLHALIGIPFFLQVKPTLKAQNGS